MSGRLTPAKLVAAAVLLLAVGLLLVWRLPSHDYLLVPDVAHPVAPLVSVPGAKPGSRSGGIYFVDVFERRATLLEKWFPSIESGSTLVPGNQIGPPGESDAARRRADLREMRRSQSTAAAVALRALGYKVTARSTGVLVDAVFGGTHAVGKLQPTDVIVSADSVPVRTLTELRSVIHAHPVGSTIRLGVRRGSDTIQVGVATVADPQQKNRPVLGIAPGQAADIRLPVAVKIDARNVGGPSAGLAFALEVMRQLGRNVDHGHRVAVTGAIELDGVVGPIGGVEQKTIGARRAHVEAFLVPAGDNARIARRYAHGLRIVPVRNLQQALHVLATLPPANR